MRWYRVGCASTNNRETAAAWARDRIGPRVVEVCSSPVGVALERWEWLRGGWARVDGQLALLGL